MKNIKSIAVFAFIGFLAFGVSNCSSLTDPTHLLGGGDTGIVLHGGDGDTLNFGDSTNVGDSTNFDGGDSTRIDTSGTTRHYHRNRH